MRHTITVKSGRLGLNFLGGDEFAKRSSIIQTSSPGEGCEIQKTSAPLAPTAEGW